MREFTSASQDLKSHRDDRKISIAIMASFVILTIQYFILIYFNLLESGAGSRIQLISKGLVGLAFLYALPPVLKRSKVKAIGIYGISISVFLLHYAIFPENRVYIMGLVFPFFFMSLPAFVYALSLRDFEVFKIVMKKSGYVVFSVGLLIGILVLTGRSSVGAYSMSLSYYMLLPTILFLDELMDKFSFKMLILIGLSLLIILSLGARGPLLGIAVFSILKFIRPNSKRTYKRALVHFSLVSAGVIGVIFLEKIIMSLYNFLQGLGINSRTLVLLLREDIHLSGRDRIYNIVLEEILERPLLGIGIAGDTRVIGSSYVHNFFIEIIGNFGIIVGIILSIALIILVVKSLLSKEYNRYNLTIIWVSLGFVHLMVSSSYLTDLKFWILLGLLINMLFNRVQKSRYTNKYITESRN